MFDFMPEDEVGRVTLFFKDNVEKMTPFKVFENIQIHRGGNQVTLETSGMPLFDSEGKFGNG